MKEDTMAGASMYAIKSNTWYQIHTNGATTTFARFYEGQDETGATLFIFQKMQSDITTDGFAEIFGEQGFDTEEAARSRLDEALELAV
jgi:hypothetical protein